MNKHFSEFTPILITSPEKRCGTTLVQRLLCSSDDALIYGEECAYDVNMAIAIFHQKRMQLAIQEKNSDQMLHDLLSGKTSQWIARLLPTASHYLKHVEEGFVHLLNGFDTYANSQGRSVWGAKLPAWNAAQIKLIKSYIPNTKVVYIARPLKDCVRSAKAQSMFRTDEDVRLFCQQWKTNNIEYTQIRNEPWLLQIEFNDLINNSHKTIKKLESFCSIKNIRIDVLRDKVNDQFALRPTKITEYIDPANLSQKEKNIVQEFSYL